MREPAGGLVPAVALVVGVGVALFSTVLVTTLTHGVRAAAWDDVGADLRLSGPTFEPEDAAAVAATEGVAAVARLADAGRLDVSGVGTSGRVSLLAVDAAALGVVQREAVGAQGVPLDLARPRGDGLPALASEGTGLPVGASGARLALATPVDLDVVGRTTGVAGDRAGDALLVVDLTTAQELTGTTVRPRVLLVDVAAGADAGLVLERIRAVAPDAHAEGLEDRAAVFEAAPVTAGTGTVLRGAVGLSLVLVVVALVLMQLLTAPRRAGVVGVLRALGAEARTLRRVVTWEVAPLATVGLVSGAMLGVLVPWVVLGATDVSVLTGGGRPTGPHLDPVVLGAVVLGLAVVTALAVTTATALGRRAGPADGLRAGEENR